MAFRLPFSLAIVVAFAGALHGQQQRTIMLHPVDLNGSVVQVGPRSIAVKDASGNHWVLNLDNGTKIKVTGSADPAMLTPGTCVRFTASIEKRTTRVKDKIDRITIFTQSPGVAERTLGIERASDRPAKEGRAGPGQPPMGPPVGFGPPPGPGPGPGGPPPGGPGQQAGPGQQPEAPPSLSTGDAPIGDAGTGNSKPAKRRGAGSKLPDKSVPDVASYDVCAQIVSCHGGRLVVNVQNRFFKQKISAELATDVKIDLDLGNVSVVKPGDKFTAEAAYLKPGVCERTMELEIALSNTLAPPGSHSRRLRASSKTASEKKAPAAGKTSGKAPAESDAAADLPPDQKALPAKPEPKRQADRQQKPPIPDDNVMPAPEGGKPEAKKPVEKPEKSPPKKDDEKDVFEK